MAELGGGEVETNFTSAQSLEVQNENEIEIVTSTPPLMMKPSPQLDPLSGARDQYLKICVPLYQAALKGDWEATKGLVEQYCSWEDPWILRERITKGRDTALHIAAAAKHFHFVEELVKVMNPQDLELTNQHGNTALSYAALSGNVGVADLMIRKNEKLPMIRGSKGMTPLYMASLFGHREVVWYLYRNSNRQDYLKRGDLIGIVNKCISTDLYDVALEMIKNHGDLAVARDGDGDTALHVLARKPSAFSDGSDRGFWKKFIFSISGVRVGCDKSSKQIQALELVRVLWQAVLKRDESAVSELIGSPTRLLFVAAELGNTMFLFELIRAYPDLIWKVDDQRRSIFHFAVLNRHASIFNLIYEIGSIKDLITPYKDDKLNTMLHLAGMLPTVNQLNVVSGAALQMQRELLWFKEVEKVVQPSYKEKKNCDGKTARELFTEKHQDLLKKGEEWMINTASQSMLVATLIATVMFAATFTAPGGNQGDTGTPIFLKKTFFMVFTISDAIALFTSSTSILMFLAILTSRYAENDFLESLPTKMIIGLATLFVSIISMMVAFSSTFFLVYHHELKWVSITISLFACVPIILFATLQYPLLVDMIRSTYGSRFLFRPKKHMLF